MAAEREVLTLQTEVPGRAAFPKQRLVEALRAEQELQLQPQGPGGARAGATAR